MQVVQQPGMAQLQQLEKVVPNSAPVTNTIAIAHITSPPESVDLGDQLFKQLEQQYKQETGQLGNPVPTVSPIPATDLPPVQEKIDPDVFESYHRQRKRGRGRPRLPKKTVQIHPKQLAMLLGFKMGTGAETKKTNYVMITGDRPHALPGPTRAL
jgi:hypothetical protein